MREKLKLCQVFHSFDTYTSFIITNLNQRFNNQLPSSINSELIDFVLRPVWDKFKYFSICFEPTSEGIDDFMYNLMETFADSFNNFLTSTKAHLEYLVKYLDDSQKNTPFEKQIVSSIMPINQKLDQELGSSKLASGTTGQQTSEITNIGIAWRKAFQTYYTPIYQKELIDKFRWLFLDTFNRIPDFMYTNPVITIKNGGAMSGEDYRFDFINLYYRETYRDEWEKIDLTNIESDIKLTGKIRQMQLKLEVSEDTTFDLTAVRLRCPNISELNISIEEEPIGKSVESQLVYFNEDIELTIYTEGDF